MYYLYINSLQYSCLEKSNGQRSMVGSVHGVPNSWTWLNDFTFTFKEAQKGVTLRLKVDITEHFNYSEWVKDIDPALNLPASTIHSIYKQRILKAAKVALGSTSSKVVFFCSWHTVRNTMGFPDGSASKDSACNAGDIGSVPGSRRSSGEGNDNPFQYSCLGNPTDRGAWWATVHRVAKSWEWVSDRTTHSWLLC